MKILIPTDFSGLSKVAAVYAAKMAERMNAELVLLNVVFMDAPPRGGAAIKVTSIEKAMVEEAERDAQNLIEEIQSECKGKATISYKVVKGFPVEDTVMKYASHHGIDMIVAGTKGATGLKKTVMGSNASALINASNIPVLTVPEFARFFHLKHLVLASDMWDLDLEMAKVIPLARLFDAHIHVLHVNAPGTKKVLDVKAVKEHLLSATDYSKITVHVIESESIIHGIDKYIADVQADMLAMFTHKITFFEKIFGKSVTQEMAFHSRVPLLSIKK